MRAGQSDQQQAERDNRNARILRRQKFRFHVILHWLEKNHSGGGHDLTPHTDRAFYADTAAAR